LHWSLSRHKFIFSAKRYVRYHIAIVFENNGLAYRLVAPLGRRQLQQTASHRVLLVEAKELGACALRDQAWFGFGRLLNRYF
jgi:hypothetical protein